MNAIKSVVVSTEVTNKKVTVFKREFLEGSELLVLTHSNGLVLEIVQPVVTLYTKKVLATSIANILTAIHAQTSLALEQDNHCKVISNTITIDALESIRNGFEPVSVAISIAAIAAIATKYDLSAWDSFNHASYGVLITQISNADSPLSILEALKTSNPAIRNKIASWAKPTTATTAVNKEVVEFDY